VLISVLNAVNYKATTFTYGIGFPKDIPSYTTLYYIRHQYGTAGTLRYRAKGQRGCCTDGIKIEACF
jgi:hypothetical protein